MAGPGTGSVPDEYAFIETGSRSRCTAGETADSSATFIAGLTADSSAYNGAYQTWLAGSGTGYEMGYDSGDGTRTGTALDVSSG
jgi:hypothetical protein|uniref:Uncharacterized protein n=1 Tax=Picea glauca TaxID=3330 RepID=A0A101M3C4_PICGL|nr:hypothetical protein ABT39_MTgene32 [Picea glauca]QHR89340.1 hypothetical protein Q903MT_gene3361 [Picea sitchensis]